MRIHGNASRFSALAAGLALVALLLPATALATLLPNPIQIPGDPDFDLGDPNLTELNVSLGEYEIDFSGRLGPGFRNRPGDTVEMEATVRFLEDLGSTDWFLVLTSIRFGPIPPGGLVCPTVAPPFATAGFLSDSFMGDLSGPVQFAGDQSPGEVCDSEGPPGGPKVFLALPFSAGIGEERTVSYTIELTESIPGAPGSLTNLQFIHTAFSVAPEPGTGLLVGAGLAALGAARRKRPRR